MIIRLSLVQRTLHDELDQSNDFRAYKIEEIGALKAELDLANNDLKTKSRENGKLEDQVRQLKKELQTLAKLQRIYPNEVKKVAFIPEMADAETLTVSLGLSEQSFLNIP